jgi:hypothetical protein
MFQLTKFTQATITSVTNRQETHGDDRKPAVTVGLKIEAANTLLDEIDPAIRLALYKAVDGQVELDGVEPTTPVLRCNSFDLIALTTSHEGWTLMLDDKIDPEDPMTFGGCKVDKLKVDAKQGGSILLFFRCGTSDVDQQRLGALGMRNGQDVWIKLLPPKKQPPVIDGTAEAFQADHPGASAEDLFAAGQDPKPEGDDDGQADGEGSTTDAAGQAQQSENWPFPKGAEDGSSDFERSAKARAAAEQAELEAGIGKAIAASKPGRRSKAAAAS